MNPETTIVHPAWYRQPWMWLVVGLPLTSVVASLWMVALSVIHRDDLVQDDWYNAGRTINLDMDAEKHAQTMGLLGTLTLEPATPAVRITITHAETLPATLQLLVAHNTLASEDMTTILTRTADGSWYGTLPRLPVGKRHLTLQPIVPAGDKTRWRLRASNVLFQGDPVALQPNG